MIAELALQFVRSALLKPNSSRSSDDQKILEKHAAGMLFFVVSCRILPLPNKGPGAWGGIHICGRAPINVTGAQSKSEIGDALYGGNDPADNSGVLSYIRLEYTGYAFSEEKEANGFTFYGVGNGTVVDHLQSYKGSDDGLEWFGGTVNVKYLVATDNSDDSFDWTAGWCK